MNSLVRKAKQGDPDAFTELMQSQMQNMYKAARSVLYNDEDVADAISETILACWEKIWQLKEEDYFRTWMTRILINKCNDILRKQRNIMLVEEIPEQLSYDRKYENVEWEEALESLDEKYRLIMLLYYVEGFKTGEIGDILSMPESTVKTKTYRLLKKIREEETYGNESGAI